MHCIIFGYTHDLMYGLVAGRITLMLQERVQIIGAQTISYEPIMTQEPDHPTWRCICDHDELSAEEYLTQIFDTEACTVETRCDRCMRQVGWYW